jgi:hypothetical protein
MIELITSKICSIVAASKARNEWLDSLPKEEANKIREEDARIALENERHRRALEIADAGRPRNFWGK